MLRNAERLGSSSDLVFYRNKKSSCGSVLADDFLTEGPDEDWCPEYVLVNFDTIPPEVQNVLITWSV